MRDQAIYNTHPTVVSILEGIKALDKDGKPVTLDNVKVDTELAKLQASKKATAYIAERAAAYPPLIDLADALAKQSSPDPIIAAEGKSQYDKYCADCLAVKARITK